MTFGSPALLALLLLVPGAVLIYAIFQSRRPRYAVRFTNLSMLANVMPRRAAWRRHLPPALYLLSLAGLVIALARPFSTIKLPRQEGTVSLVIDVSGSMDATDVSPTRLTAAISDAERFVNQLPPRFQIGVVAFSTSAQVLTPPTLDRARVRQALESLRANGGTAMGDGIERALDFSRQPATTHDRLLKPGEGPGSQPSASGASSPSGPGQPQSSQPGASASGSASPAGQPQTGQPGVSGSAGATGQGSQPQTGQPGASGSASPAGQGVQPQTGQPGASGSAGATGQGSQPPAGQSGASARGAASPAGQGSGQTSASAGSSASAVGNAVGQPVPSVNSAPPSVAPPAGQVVGPPQGQGQGGGGTPASGTQRPPAAVLLLSDGASNSGTTPPDIAAQDARKLGVPVYTIALGTSGGTLDFRVPGSRRVRQIAVPPDPAQLKQVADISGGRFFEAPSERDLRHVYENLASHIGFETQQQDITPLFVAAAAVLLLTGGALATLWFHRFP